MQPGPSRDLMQACDRIHHLRPTSRLHTLLRSQHQARFKGRVGRLSVRVTVWPFHCAVRAHFVWRNSITIVFILHGAAFRLLIFQRLLVWKGQLIFQRILVCKGHRSWCFYSSSFSGLKHFVRVGKASRWLLSGWAGSVSRRLVDVCWSRRWIF